MHAMVHHALVQTLQRTTGRFGAAFLLRHASCDDDSQFSERSGTIGLGVQGVDDGVAGDVLQQLMIATQDTVKVRLPCGFASLYTPQACVLDLHHD
jgi:hypothetical protein